MVPGAGEGIFVILLLCVYFMVSFIYAWNFFVNRDISQYWVWYSRHLAGAIVGIVFAVFVCSGIIGIFYISKPITNLWPFIFSGVPFFVGLVILGKRLLPASNKSA
jgi:uncharacterized membrane protein